MGKRSKKWTRTIQFKPNNGGGYDLWDADNDIPLTENDLTDEEKKLVFLMKEIKQMIND